MFFLDSVHCGQWFDSEVPHTHTEGSCICILGSQMVALFQEAVRPDWKAWVPGLQSSEVVFLLSFCSDLLLLVPLRWEQAMLQVSVTMQLGVWLTHLPCRDELSSWTRCPNQPFLPQVTSSARHLAAPRSCTDPRPSYILWDAFALFESGEVCGLWLASPRTQQPCKGASPWEPWEFMPFVPTDTSEAV